MASLRIRLALFLALITLLLFFSTRHGVPLRTLDTTTSISPPASTNGAGEDVQNALREIGLTKEFQYQRICLKPTVDKSLRRTEHVNFTISEHVLQKPVSLSVSSLELRDSPLPPCHAATSVSVPASDPAVQNVDTRTIMLAMVSTASQLEQSLPEMAHWLADTHSTLLVVLSDDEVPAISIKALKFLGEALHIDLILANRKEALLSVTRDKKERDAISRGKIVLKTKTASTDEDKEVEKRRTEYEEAKLALSLASLSASNIPQTVKWLFLLDPSTFVPGLPSLLANLSTLDPSEPHFLTGPSPAPPPDSDIAWRPAPPEAGILLSIPLVRTLAAHVDECAASTSDEGSKGLRACVPAVTSPRVDPVVLPGLYDLADEKDGKWYESSAWPLLSLRAATAWSAAGIGSAEAHVVAEVAGEGSWLGRWVSGDGVVLSNGYGIRVGGEEGWWRLERAIKGLDGAVRQVYVRRADSGRGIRADGVIEVDWMP